MDSEYLWTIFNAKKVKGVWATLGQGDLFSQISTALCQAAMKGIVCTIERIETSGDRMKFSTRPTFDWDRASVIGKGTTEHTRDFIEAWNTTSTCVNQCVPGYRVLRDYWRRRRQAHPSQRGEPHPLPLSPMFMLTWPHPYLLFLYYLPLMCTTPPSPFPCFLCFDKPDPSPTDNIYANAYLWYR